MKDSKKKPLWEGRFSAPGHADFFSFNRSLGFDQRLFTADIKGSLAHVSVLKASKILNNEEASKLRDGLMKVLLDTKANPKVLEDSQIEDVHSYIETKLTELLGELGKKVHTGRSRNDQVSTATRIWLMEESQRVEKELKQLMLVLLDIAEKNISTVIPGYTHLQRAQPILFAHWCHAYIEMLFRDEERLKQAYQRTAVLPLGSGALAGSSLAIERQVALEELEFLALSQNSLDGVSDRDFILDWLSFASILMVHLSRLAEDLILYATSEFSFITLGDEVSSGSSLMPQKKNPDALELIRGKSGRVFGNLSGFLATMKGLPMAYNKDLQEDKETLFDTVDTISACLRNMTLVLNFTSVNSEWIGSQLDKGYMSATDLADLLVKEGIPFREAHKHIGKLVGEAVKQNLNLDQLDAKVFEKILPGFFAKAQKVLNPRSCTENKISTGGTSSQRVKEALLLSRKKLTIS